MGNHCQVSESAFRFLSCEPPTALHESEPVRQRIAVARVGCFSGGLSWRVGGTVHAGRRGGCSLSLTVAGGRRVPEVPSGTHPGFLSPGDSGPSGGLPIGHGHREGIPGEQCGLRRGRPTMGERLSPCSSKEGRRLPGRGGSGADKGLTRRRSLGYTVRTLFILQRGNELPRRASVLKGG